MLQDGRSNITTDVLDEVNPARQAKSQIKEFETLRSFTLSFATQLYKGCLRQRIASMAASQPLKAQTPPLSHLSNNHLLDQEHHEPASLHLDPGF